MDIEKLEEKIGYKFSNKDLLHRALTTRDFAEKQKQQNQDCEHQEVLSTLGDAVLKLVLSDLLIPYCKTSEDLTNKRKELENEEKQAEIAQGLGIEQFIRMSNGELKDEKKKGHLEATFEALIGAIFMDAEKYEDTKAVISTWFHLSPLFLV